MNRVSIAVQSANGRGRIDITEKAPGPIVLMDSIDFAPLGQPGDYYLFDTTTLLLVQPRSHTFVVFALRDGPMGHFKYSGIWIWIGRCRRSMSSPAAGSAP